LRTSDETTVTGPVVCASLLCRRHVIILWSVLSGPPRWSPGELFLFLFAPVSMPVVVLFGVVNCSELLRLGHFSSAWRLVAVLLAFPSIWAVCFRLLAGKARET